MTWLKVDDGEWMAPDTLKLGNEAYGIYTRLRSYCAAFSTDGLVPAEVAALVAGGQDNLLARLELTGVAQLRTDGSVYLPAFLEHNPSKAQVEANRAQRAEAGRKGGQKSRRNGSS